MPAMTRSKAAQMESKSDDSRFNIHVELPDEQPVASDSSFNNHVELPDQKPEYDEHAHLGVLTEETQEPIVEWEHDGIVYLKDTEGFLYDIFYTRKYWIF